MEAILIILVILMYTSWAGLYKMFEKAGQKGWFALIPFLNFYIWLKIIGRPLYWILLLFVPIVNVFIYAYMHVDLVRSFGKEGLGEHAASILFPFVFFPKIGFSEDKYLGPAASLPKVQKTKNREWTEAIVFAVVAATLIRWLILEAFTIPTPSMEGSLLVGDYLFVSKVHYGARTPKTVIQLPLTHQTIWFTDIPSYLDWIQLPQKRLPGLTKVKRGDVVVFNYPPEFNHPTDLKTNYIKRCVAAAGDTLLIKDREVIVNGEAVPFPEEVQFNYFVKFKPNEGSNYNYRHLLEKFEKYPEKDVIQVFSGGLEISLTPAEAKQIANLRYIEEVSFNLPMQKEPVLYPYSSDYRWTVDNYGPIYIPKKGDVMEVNAKNLAMYETVITRYENLNDVIIQGDKLFIDGKEVSKYTFSQDYFFMMGDNRHNSADSRFWGFVPADHIVGKAVFIWMSIDPSANATNKIRWDRLFTIIE